MRSTVLFLAVVISSQTALGAEPQASSRRVFSYDFPGFQVGTAEYAEGPTGCTVFYFPKGATAAVDIRGGAAAVRESSSLDPMNSWGYVDAIVLAGGSTFGLDAASGVMQRLLELRGGSTHFDSIPVVPAAIVYDFSGRDNAVYPDKALGAAAFDASKTNQLEIGSAGAGVNVSVGKYFGRAYGEKSGQGAAFVAIGNIRVFVLSVVNAVGNVLDRRGQILAGSFDREKNERFSIPERLLANLTKPTPEPMPGKKDARGNTTISIVITNAEISRNDLSRLAAMTHTAMGRVIEPFQTPWDGDSLFAVTTGTEKLPKEMNVNDLGTIAGHLMQSAVMEAVKR